MNRALLASPFGVAAAALATLLISSCGATFPRYADYPARERFEVREATGDPAIDALAERFYAPAMDPAAMREEVGALLARFGDDATLNEMAAHLAELREDDHAAWAHWLRAATDTRSPFTSIYLDRALNYDLTTSEQNATLITLRELARSHPDPSVRVDASRRLVRYLEAYGLYREANEVSARLDMIRDWMVIGAFDNDQGRGFHAEHPPEAGIDLDATVRGVLLPVRWRAARAIDRTGVVRLSEMVSPDRWVVAYLMTHVYSDRARDATLRLTTPTGTKAWLNGQLVLSQERLARSATDNIVLPVRLEAGWNRLVIKSAQDDVGAWLVGARFTELDGAPLDGVRYEAALHEPAAVEAHAAPANVSPLEDAIAEVEPALRRELLAHHDSARNGFEGDALAQARRLLELAPEHPVVLYHAAITHWTNDELGTAQDLLNAGVDRFEEQAGFRWQRGAFYRERDRYDRAIEDLERARALEPAARLAAMELSGTYGDRGWREHECRTLAGVVERWPGSGWAQRALGYCLQQRGYLREAEARYREADGLEPGHAWNLERLSTLARWRQDDGDAIRQLERLRDHAPWSTHHLLTLAEQHRYAGNRIQARALLREAMERDPAWSTPHHRLGVMAFEDGDWDAAREAWSSALARDPDNAALADRIDALEGESDDPGQDLMPSDEAIEAALAAAGELTIDPGAHTVLVLDDEVTTVQQDGSATRRITQVSLAVTTDGRDELIQNHVPRTARILQAFSVSPSGERQEASSIRGGVVRFRGLEVGSRIALQYVYHSAPPAFLPNHFVSSWVFQGIHRQLGQARWVVQVPAGRALAMHVQGPVEHTLAEGQGEYDVHTFTGANVPPLVPEPSMPPVRDLIASVTLSTLTDWREYVEWERALLSEVFESNAQLRDLARQLTADASTPQERLDRIYRYVSQEIRYQQDYEDTIAGVRPHSCPVVLERGYGDCKDKAVLMILLGREVGLDIRFAVLRTRNAGQVQQDVPNQQFNHAIVYVPPQEGVEGGFLDPTTDGLDLGNVRADDQGATALVLDPSTDAYEFIPIPFQSPELSYFRCEVGVSVTSSEAAEAQADCRVRGGVASAFRRVMRNEERAVQLRQNVAHSLFAGSTVTDASAEHVEDITEPLHLRLTLDVSPALQPQGRERRIRVPSPFDLGRLTRLERRRMPLRLGVPESARWEIRFEAPPRGRITRTPDDFTVEHPCFSVSRRSVTRGRVATVTIEYSRTCTDVAPDDYPELRRQAQRAANQLQAEVVITP